ncbi:hypothetical protein HPULCUR_002991 [Helicostylum pulchrum]|uniref:CWH43-like N-terminal domain-containing protein n=1 Tax=Helicostylum pulchrum TaxID=562976 RepID=A0ABP9XS36_9FUNG
MSKRLYYSALVVGCYTHYDKIVQNEYFGYPQEWFPSVSATTGDRYPARALFQILIALTAGPRFALVYLWYICTTVSTTRSKRFSKLLLSVGLIRTIACGGWVFITSTDDHSIHDIAMHKVHRVPGAYTIYALFEWSLIFYDVAFDAITSFDFEKFELKITHRDKIGLEEKDVA